jgi:transposase-like protein
MTELKRYSESFKRQVIDELKANKFHSLSACARHYGIAKYETIVKWLRGEGLTHLIPSVRIIDIETK